MNREGAKHAKKEEKEEDAVVLPNALKASSRLDRSDANGFDITDLRDRKSSVGCASNEFINYI